MQVHRVTTGAFQAHTYFLCCDRTRETLVIDPGEETNLLLETIATEKFVVTHIAATHAHLDHIWGVGALKAATGAPIHLHRGDEFLYTQLAEQGSWFGFELDEAPPVDAFLNDGDVLRFGDESVRVRHVPGHSPGHVMFYTEADAWVGDCLFASSIGRVDLPGGDGPTLMDSIYERIVALGPQYRVHPGHGPSTTIEKELATNPFLSGRIGLSLFQ
jgi:glyoxylase-like metal-dependent hydrolase (beta-lactamase superfamily II)